MLSKGSPYRQVTIYIVWDCGNWRAEKNIILISLRDIFPKRVQNSRSICLLFFWLLKISRLCKA